MNRRMLLVGLAAAAAPSPALASDVTAQATTTATLRCCLVAERDALRAIAALVGRPASFMLAAGKDVATDRIEFEVLGRDDHPWTVEGGGMSEPFTPEQEARIREIVREKHDKSCHAPAANASVTLKPGAIERLHRATMLVGGRAVTDLRIEIDRAR